MKLSSTMMFVNIYEEQVKKFLGEQVDLSCVESKNMKSSIGPLAAFQVSNEKNAIVRLTNAMNYLDIKIKVNKAFEIIYILSLNVTCWSLHSRGESDSDKFANEYYKERDKFLDNNNDDDNSSLLNFLD